MSTLSRLRNPKPRVGFPVFGVLIAFLSFLYSISTWAEYEEESQTVKDPQIALEWQRVDLQERLQTKLQKALSASLPANQFVVNVNLVLKEPEPKPSPTATATPTPKPTASPAALLSTDGERVSLGKLDVDAPIFKEQKSEVAVSAPSPLAEHQEHNETEANLFKNIDKLKVSVLLDTPIADSKKPLVEKIIRDTAAPITSVTVDLTLDKMELTTPEVKSLKTWLIEFKLPIGFLLATFIATFIFGFFSWLIFRGYRNLESKKIHLMEAQNEKVNEVSDARAEAALGVKADGQASPQSPSFVGGAVSTVALSGATSSSLSSGFEKFRELLKESPDQAAGLVKRWLKTPSKEISEALALLPRTLSTEEFLTLFKYLTLENRKTWKRILSSTPVADRMDSASQFMALQIVDTLIAPAVAVDETLEKLLSEIEITESLAVASENPEMGGLLINLLPSLQVAQIFSLMKPDLANAVTLSSLNFSESDLLSKTPTLKEAIQRVKSQAKPESTPFMDKATEMFSTLDPEKEGTVFQALAQSGQVDLLKTTAQQFFPAELVLQLPGPVIKASLDRLPLSRRAELLMSLDESSRGLLLEAAGAPGSKVRDLVELELQQVQADPVRTRRTQKGKSQYWREFVQLVRLRLQSNELAAEQAEPILNAWLSQKTGQPMSRGDDSGQQPPAAA